MTADEIRALARTPDDQVESFLQTKSESELRWQILIQRFHHPHMETRNENSSPE